MIGFGFVIKIAIIRWVKSLDPHNCSTIMVRVKLPDCRQSLSGLARNRSVFSAAGCASLCEFVEENGEIHLAF